MSLNHVAEIEPALVAPHGDPFVARHRGSRAPHVPFALTPGDRLLLIGDSITAARRYSRMLESYLSFCVPQLGVHVRNIGKGGETAAGFLARVDAEVTSFAPTVATVCYGMNDSGYANDNQAAADNYKVAMATIVQKLTSSGVRVVLTAPTCIGQLPPWDFVTEQGGTLDGLNKSLVLIRNAALELAESRGLPFVDHFWNLYDARQTGTAKYGSDYAVCGRDDGVHPSTAGHVVMAHGLFGALGFDGELGTFDVDLRTGTATTQGEHRFVGMKDRTTVTFESKTYPFCAEGAPDRDWSVRSGMTLVPFNQQFNRMMLRVKGTVAERYRVSWMDQESVLEEWHEYAAWQLLAGINLADQFQLTPFSRTFSRVDDLVFQKQTVEQAKIWRQLDREGLDVAENDAVYEERRAELVTAIRSAFVPITHNLRIEAVR